MLYAALGLLVQDNPMQSIRCHIPNRNQQLHLALTKSILAQQPQRANGFVLCD